MAILRLLDELGDGRGLLLVTLVTALSVAIGVGLAFLAARAPTSRAAGSSLLWLRSRWRSPDAVAAFAWISALPQIAGLTGAVLVLTLCCYPYVYLPVLAALRRADPGLEEVARRAGPHPVADLPRGHPAPGAPLRGRGGLLVALYTLSDFGAVSILRYDVFTRVIYAAYARVSTARRPPCCPCCSWR